MKKIILYSTTALIATGIVIFWMMNPDMTEKSPYPKIATMYVVIAIVFGYTPLFGTIFLNFRKTKKQ